MKHRNIFLLCLTLFCVNSGSASKVVSANDANWNSPLTWDTGVVPENPDTIIIRHYVTFSSDLIIQAPTVVLIEADGVLCGDYLMEISCGASVVNYGNWYVNRLEMKQGGTASYNYNFFYFKNSTVLSGCGSGSSTGGFYNVPPLGHINTWAPTLCRTAETRWPKPTTGIQANGNAEDYSVSVSPNPINSGYLTVRAKGEFEMKLYDTRGSLLYEDVASNNGFIDLHGYANGFYFVTVNYRGTQVHRKILVAH